MPVTDQLHGPTGIPAEVIAFRRRLDEVATDRLYLRHDDEDGGLWLWEAVRHEGELVAIKQVEVDSSGTVSRYWWQRMEDDSGFLTDQPLSPEDEGLVRIGADEFHRYWNDGGRCA
jgi:hypothetical protein